MAKKRPLPHAHKQPLGEDPERRPRASRGRTGPEETPVELRSPGIDLPDEVEPFVRAKLGAKLAAFAEQIERVTVTFRDLNGPRGGEDIECTLRVVLVSRPDVVVHETGVNVQRAFESALRRVGEAVKRDLERAGYSARNRRAPSGGEAAASSGAEDESAESTPPTPPRRSTTKDSPSARSGENLAKRARDRTHTPGAHAESSRAHPGGGK